MLKAFWCKFLPADLWPIGECQLTTTPNVAHNLLDILLFLPPRPELDGDHFILFYTFKQKKQMI